ncbi:unnamed protein product [Blepharisma stoltei]|uniref:Major facilitator superfamily (MFS) profile domain-containing protein n=1 Tax=Blepharisma stoltei TaxID=1481888 RepID=A0AAU9JAY9_9CILI|nr:unnamed protein product [Blepharisma stoltei]
MEDKVQQLNTILDNIGWGRYSTFNFFVCGGAWLTLNYLNISISFLMRTAQNEWNLESYQVGLINATHMLGICIGSILFGFIGDRYGRVFSFKISGLLSIAGSVILAFSPNYETAVPLILIAGMGGGGEITAGGPTYIEACPPKKRWTLVLISTCWVIGAMFAAFIALVFELSNSFQVWRGVYLVGAIIEFLWWIPRLFLYESTRFLLIHNKIEECENVLRWK